MSIVVYFTSFRNAKTLRPTRPIRHLNGQTSASNDYKKPTCVKPSIPSLFPSSNMASTMLPLTILAALYFAEESRAIPVPSESKSYTTTNAGQNCTYE